MLPSQLNNSPKKASAFVRSSPSPAPQTQTRPKSAIIAPSHGLELAKGHLRNSSVSQLSPTLSSTSINRERSNSRNNVASGTFAPSFIKSEEMRRGADEIRGLEGENDFSGNKYVWLRDPQKAFVRGLVLEELEGNRLLVQSDDGEVGILIPKMTKWGLINSPNSNGKSMRTKWTKSTRPSSTRQMIWQN